MSPSAQHVQFSGLSPAMRELVGEISRQAVVILEQQQAISAKDAEIARLKSRVAALEETGEQ